MRSFAIALGLLVLGVLVFGAAGWFLLGVDPAPARNESPQAQAGPDAEPPLTARLDGDVGPSTETAPAGRSAVERDGLGRVPPAAGEDGISVLAVREEDETPIPGARIHVLDLAALSLSQEEWSSFHEDDITFARARLPYYETDATGRTRLPRSESHRILVAVHEDRYARFAGQPPSDDEEAPLVLSLQVDHTVAVQVVGAGGNPASRAQILVGRVTDDGEKQQPALQGESDPDGRWVRRHFQQFGSGAPAVELEAWLPGLRSDPVRIDPRDPPPEVPIVLPPSGAIVVRAQEADGRPVDLRTVTDRRVSLNEIESGARAMDANQTQRYRSELGPGGVAHFTHVRPGRRFRVRSFEVGQQDFDGPTAVGETTEVVLRRPKGGAFLVGRLVDPDGVPRADDEIALDCRNDSGSRRVSLRTGPDGRFRGWTEPRFVGSATGFVVTPEDMPRDPRLAWSVTLEPRRLQTGDNDLGDLVVEPARPIVSGRFFVDGEPARAAVNPHIERNEGRYWQQEFNARLIQEDDGRFEIFGIPDSGHPLRLGFFKSQYMEVEPIEFTAGATDLEVRLTTGGTLTAFFLVDDGVPESRLDFALLDPDAAEDPNDPWRDLMKQTSHSQLQPAGEGRRSRSWTGLAPGRRSLLVRAAGHSRPLVEIPELEIRAGGCEDPRLDAIDLRGLVREIEIRARDADGQPVVSKQAFVLAGDGSRDVQGFHLGKGVVTLAAGEALDLLIDAPGHVVERVPAVRSDREVQLRRAPTVTARVESSGAPLPEGFQLELRCTPLDVPQRSHLRLDTGYGMGYQAHWEAAIPVAVDGTAVLPARRVGAHRIRVRLVRGDEARSVRGVEPDVWDVTEPLSGEALVFRLPEGALERALERFD